MSTDFSTPSESFTEKIDLAKLRKAIVDAFNKDELRTLTFDLGIEYENLGAETRDGLARELVAYCDRNLLLQKLLEFCAKLRPQINWYRFILTVAEDEPPFKGLYSFDETDAELYFGREDLIVELLSFLKENSFLAIVGASGSGKSSLVRAGVIPGLKHKLPLVNDNRPPDGSNNWLIHIITPTANPLEALAESLTQDVESLTAFESLLEDLSRSPQSLHLFARRAINRSDGKQLLLIVDQFEEVFTLCHDEEIRQLFIDNLMTAVAPESGGLTKVMITFRADFYHHCATYNNLRYALETKQKFIGKMERAQLERAIKEPARRKGITFEDGLVDLLLREVEDEPGGLPLLSHALLETWKNRDGRLMTFEGYASSGGIQGAISQTADEVYTYYLSSRQQDIARNIFLRSTEVGTNIQETRRRAGLDELIPKSENAEAVHIVLNILAEKRLVTVTENSAEIAHEALIRKWPLLQQWIEEDRESLRIQNRLSEAAKRWDESNRTSYLLYRGVRLEQALNLPQNNKGQLTSLEEEFLNKSNALKMADQRRKWLIRTAILTVAILVTSISLLLGLTQRQLAQRNEEIANKNAEIATTAAIRAQINSQSNLLLSGIVTSYAIEDYETAGLLFIELVNRDPEILEKLPEEFDGIAVCSIFKDLGLANDVIVDTPSGKVNLCTTSANDINLAREYLSAETIVKIITDTACGLVSRNLTKDEWETYIIIDPYSQTCTNLP